MFGKDSSRRRRGGGGASNSNSTTNPSSGGRPPPPASSRGTASLTGNSSVSSACPPPVSGRGRGGRAAVAPRPPVPAAPMSRRPPPPPNSREGAERRRNMEMHVRDHMTLPPYVVNGEALIQYDAHELDAGHPARLHRAADVRRVAEEARRAFNNDPARKWTKAQGQKYPEEIRGGTQFGIPPTIIGHPLLGGPSTYLHGLPGPCRVWTNKNDSTKAEVVYHSKKERDRRLETLRQKEQNVSDGIDRLTKQIKETSIRERPPLKKRMTEEEARRARVQQQSQNLRSKKHDPFVKAAYIPPDTKKAPLVPNLANPHQRQYDQNERRHTFACQQCGGQALVSDDGKIIQRCRCAKPE
ncbi:uncharacterized protein SPSK_07681 [Sporothrix schenckii 1099-18]|uniref:Uncharacterized protein n=1 Tax=Sporothrix schenckii 1099-18 TaxID=1397361 RepID=A0A0F2MGZ6_SPOSC|nr:uncharacterized protein SPSK_07681 [Sporothrix schenckii 1099-18]KJR88917.1 hypothetical protein SPSK_07681 [Sporothrix schenckii 1099-18]